MNSCECRQSPSDAIFLHLILLVFIQCCIIRCRTSFDPLIKRPLSDLYILSIFSLTLMFGNCGGEYRSRTDDLLNANQAL